MTNDHLQRQRAASDKRALFGNMLHASKREAAIFFLIRSRTACCFVSLFVCVEKGLFFLKSSNICTLLYGKQTTMASHFFEYTEMYVAYDK